MTREWTGRLSVSGQGRQRLFFLPHLVSTEQLRVVGPGSRNTVWASDEPGLNEASVGYHGVAQSSLKGASP